MPWFDVGVNLLDPRFDLAQVLQEAADAEVHDILVISSDIDESEKALALLTQHRPPNNSTAANPFSKLPQLHATAGVHPHYADSADAYSWAKLRAILADNQISAVGECGLDFNRNFSSQSNQIAAFDTQLQLAREFQLGVYLHERDAFEQQCKMLRKVYQDLPFLVAHCFTGNEQQMLQYLDFGCYVGVTGWICDNARGADLQQAVRSLPLNRLLLETDAPYLFPKTLRPRAKQNAPKYISAIAEKVAEIKQIDVEEVAAAAYSNAKALFSRGAHQSAYKDFY
ncbi:TatD family hydrolase [Glaciecola siphonariae]|uniref:TatD family hydrolase n=1 Tax=Glaciecola siphonariae TaxID=521012 RepID=A0ABV9LZ45_9ALTE